MKLEYLQDTWIEPRGIGVVILRPAWLTNRVVFFCAWRLYAEAHGAFFAWHTGCPVPKM